MKRSFGLLPNGEEAFLYTITGSGITAKLTDVGASLVQLHVPDSKGNVADVVLGYDTAAEYVIRGDFLGATVGRFGNRIKGGSFRLGDTQITMDKSEGNNNLHSGLAFFKDRLWTVENHTENSICFRLESPHGDQGFPGNACIRVTYTLEQSGLKIAYDAVSDRDTVFNMTNHSYFNLAGHDRPEMGRKQVLSMPARFYVEVDAELIPTGVLRPTAGTAFDFRKPMPLGREDAPEGSYDHCFEVFTAPCAILSDPESGRTMAVITDLPGVQIYAAGGIDEMGKGGVHYGEGSAVCLETEFYPDSVNHPEWPQPITRAGERYHTETIYKFN